VTRPGTDPANTGAATRPAAGSGAEAAGVPTTGTAGGSVTGPAAPPALQVSDLRVAFRSARVPTPVVRGLSFAVRRGEVLGVVGESGCGKSVTALALMGLLPGDAEVTGSVRLRGRELLGLGDEELSRLRGAALSMVFQDPLSAFTPVYTIGAQLIEAIQVHRPVPDRQATAEAVELLDLVGIPEPARAARAYPHEFSGGMRQRAVIAMAIANQPDVIICDEPTTALDVTVQAQVLEVLDTARRVTGAAIVLITHDLGVVAGTADRVLVMYAGRGVEEGTAEEVFHRARMPYTMGLIGSVPRVDLGDEAPPLVLMPGGPPGPAALPSGCSFAPRCPLVLDECHRTEPLLPPVPPLGAEGDPSPPAVDGPAVDGPAVDGRAVDGTGRGHRAACVRAEHVERAALRPSEVFPVPPPRSGGPAARSTRPTREPVLRVNGLVRHHPLHSGALLRRRVGTVHAVDGVSFDIRAGETLGLVGESGCGKTSTLMEILRLDSHHPGQITVLGRDSATLGRRERTRLRRDVQVVFQDPRASLDPRMPVADLLAEPLRAQGQRRSRTGGRVRELLRLVGLDSECLGRYPQDFSGGQLQRIAVARALACEPALVLLDEPVSSLDVSVRAGVLALLADLQDRLGLAYLFVAHDLSLVRHTADRVAVMYLGRIVEIGAVSAVFTGPAHPYTQALLSAVPVPDPRRERERVRIRLTGEAPSPTRPPSGCRFRTRCPRFAALGPTQRDRCTHEEPVPIQIDHDHAAACHFATKASVL
jgi:peptide/nickel transport system ATP-binding protein